MKLKRMTATFGCLEHQSLTFGDGLNLIRLPNEGGKSTWANFLRVMLYGLNTRERDKKGFLADKNRYTPWQGGIMEGEILLSWKGRDILLRRFTQGNTPMGGFSAVYAETGDPVPDLTADHAGEQLTGVSQAVFQRSAFLGQSAHQIDAVPELERRIAALVSSGEETVSAQEVKKTLQTWARRRKTTGSRGEIPELEQRRNQLRQALEEFQELNGRILEDESRLDRLAAERQTLEQERERHRAQNQNRQAEAYHRAKEELDRAAAREEKLKGQLPKHRRLPAKEDLETARDEVAYLRTLEANLKLSQKQRPEAEHALQAAREAAEDPIFRGENGEAACRRARNDCARAQALEQNAKKAAVRGWQALGLGALLGGLVCTVFSQQDSLLFGLLGGGAVLLFGGVLGCFLARRRMRRADQERQEILSRYGVARAEEAVTLAEDYRARRDRVTQAEETLERLAQAEKEIRAEHYETAKRVQLIVQLFAPEVSDVFGFSAAISRALTLYEGLKDAARDRESAQRLLETVAVHGTGEKQDDFTAPTIPLEQVEQRLKEIEREQGALQTELSMALGRRGAAGDPAVIHAQLEENKEALRRARLEYQALEAAEGAIEEADREMKARFSPELNRCAGAYLEALTGGRYQKLMLDRAMEAQAQTAQSVTPRDVLALSRGTADQIWLAVRLAVCRLALPQEEPCPLVLDDALVNFDDTRMELALALLRRLAEQRQILLFTCQGREQAAAREMDGVTCVGG